MSVIKSHIAAMSAYKPPLEGRNPKAHLLLDFNERTLPVSEPVKQALIDYINDGRLQMYPSYGNIVERLADYVGVSPEQLMITNGSDQGIDLIFRATCQAGQDAIIPVPNFAMYKQCAGIENLNVIEPCYTKKGGFPVASVLDAVTDSTKIICISNPSNPSGTVVPREDIFKIAKAAAHVAILVDECYFEYAKISVVDAVDQYPNIIVTRTLSKTWGIPSLRMGYIVANSDVITALLNVRGPYDINQLAVVATHAALDNPEYTQVYVKEVMEQSKPMFERFLDENNIAYWPSGGNYVWCFPVNPEKVNQALIDNHILVRPKPNAEGQIGLRVTLGSKAQTAKMMDVFGKVI